MYMCFNNNDHHNVIIYSSIVIRIIIMIIFSMYIHIYREREIQIHICIYMHTRI